MNLKISGGVLAVLAIVAIVLFAPGAQQLLTKSTISTPGLPGAATPAPTGQFVSSTSSFDLDAVDALVPSTHLTESYLLKYKQPGSASFADLGTKTGGTAVTTLTPGGQYMYIENASTYYAVLVKGTFNGPYFTDQPKNLKQATLSNVATFNADHATANANGTAQLAVGSGATVNGYVIESVNVNTQWGNPDTRQAISGVVDGGNQMGLVGVPPILAVVNTNSTEFSNPDIRIGVSGTQLRAGGSGVQKIPCPLGYDSPTNGQNACFTVDADWTSGNNNGIMETAISFVAKSGVNPLGGGPGGNSAMTCGADAACLTFADSNWFQGVANGASNGLYLAGYADDAGIKQGASDITVKFAIS